MLLVKDARATQPAAPDQPRLGRRRARGGDPGHPGRARRAQRGADPASPAARPGRSARQLRRGDAKLAERLLLELKAIFGDRLYVELMRHGEEDDAVEPALIDLAYATICRWSPPTTSIS